MPPKEARELFTHGFQECYGGDNKTLNSNSFNSGKDKIIQAANAGDQLARAYCLYKGWKVQGWNVQKDSIESFKMLVEIENEYHCCWSQLLLGLAYFWGDGCKKNEKKRKEVVRQLSEE